MADGEPFIDYYDVLEVDPNCDAKLLEAAYHRLAMLHHPDRSGSADTRKFSELSEAYTVLRHGKKRAKYDRIYFQNFPERHTDSTPDNEARDEGPALDDADAHARILKFLYARRRENAQDAGVIAYYLQEMLHCSDEIFDFHRWYLKEKGFISVTEQGTLAITIQGVDHVIAMSRTAKAEKLLLAGSGQEPM